MTISRRLISILFSLLIFLTVMLGTNAYQYFKIKNDISSNVIMAVTSNNHERILTFFQSVEEKLNMVHDWGKNGVIDLKSQLKLNKQFIPLIEHEPRFSGLVMADNTGREYYLNRQNEGYLVRQTASNGVMHYQHWTDSETPGKEWEENSDYKSLDRPWFTDENRFGIIRWTRPYTFYHTRQEGFTASISWQNAGDRKRFTVFGIDILKDSLQKILTETAKNPSINIFLLNAEDGTFLTGLKTTDTGSDIKKKELSAALVKAIGQWRESGKNRLDALEINSDKQKWLVALMPLSAQGGFTWVGAAAKEKALLAELKKELYSIDFTDFIVAVITISILFIYLFKSGVLQINDNSDTPPEVRLMQHINDGENAHLEFKSTVRKNLKNGKFGKEIELAWTKAIVAFLNTEGGTLIIGVEDDGTIIGLEADEFENNDRCLLHVKNIIHQHIGAEFTQFIDVIPVETDGQYLLMINCRPAKDAVFLRIGKNEEFYIRSGPSSTKLSPSQMINHISQK